METVVKPVVLVNKSLCAIALVVWILVRDLTLNLNYAIREALDLGQPGALLQTARQRVVSVSKLWQEIVMVATEVAPANPIKQSRAT